MGEELTEEDLKPRRFYFLPLEQRLIFKNGLGTDDGRFIKLKKEYDDEINWDNAVFFTGANWAVCNLEEIVKKTFKKQYQVKQEEHLDGSGEWYSIECLDNVEKLVVFYSNHMPGFELTGPFDVDFHTQPQNESGRRQYLGRKNKPKPPINVEEIIKNKDKQRIRKVPAYILRSSLFTVTNPNHYRYEDTILLIR